MRVGVVNIRTDNITQAITVTDLNGNPTQKKNLPNPQVLFISSGKVSIAFLDFFNHTIQM
jgi:hypothetical protein